MITADQIIAHMIGDYVLQSDWMAQEKTKRSLAAFAHVVTYVLPFLFLTQDPIVLATIVGTHFVIDRWRLARYVCWLKNLMAPKASRSPWRECIGTGYHHDRPPWMAVWLLIIADNVLHIVINGVALRYLS